MKKNYPHNVIRLRKGKRVKEHIFWIIAIQNKKRVKSWKVIYKLGFIQFGQKGMFSINMKKLVFFLNKGFILKESVKKIIALISYSK